jgi:hypothetical protein
VKVVADGKVDMNLSAKVSKMNAVGVVDVAVAADSSNDDDGVDNGTVIDVGDDDADKVGVCAVIVVVVSVAVAVAAVVVVGGIGVDIGNADDAIALDDDVSRFSIVDVDVVVLDLVDVAVDPGSEVTSTAEAAAVTKFGDKACSIKLFMRAVEYCDCFFSRTSPAVKPGVVIPPAVTPGVVIPPGVIPIVVIPAAVMPPAVIPPAVMPAAVIPVFSMDFELVWVKGESSAMLDLGFTAESC